MQNNLTNDLKILCNQFYSPERDSEAYKFSANQLINNYKAEVLSEIFTFSEMFYVSLLLKHHQIIQNLSLNSWFKFIELYSNNEGDLFNILEFVYKYLCIDSLKLLSNSTTVNKDLKKKVFNNYIKCSENLLISEFFKSEYQDLLTMDIQKITAHLKMEGGSQAKTTKKEIVIDLEYYSQLN